MASLNIKKETAKTHEGGVACRTNPEQQLRRSVMACMLWEDTFYEDGISIADRISDTVKLVEPTKVAQIAVEARSSMNLRHVPLLLCVALARSGKLAKETLAEVIQRPDELCEFLAIYWKDGRCPISAQAKKGLAMAFTKFTAYSLAKYNRDKAVKLRDVLFLCHPKPTDNKQQETWNKLVNGTLEAPDTWEVALSEGGDKKTHWTRLLTENKLGGLALLRNLRNMKEASVDESLVTNALLSMKTDRILPFRFIAAARYAPQWESSIEKAMLKSLAETPKFTGKTIVLVDVSGSMEYDRISKKSDMSRLDAACGLAVCVREMCDNVAVYSFSNHLERVPDRHGFALRDAITQSQSHGATYLNRAFSEINESYDRIIIITDEQSHDSLTNPEGKGYVINVASYRNGVGYGKWLHVDGFSEAILNYIHEYEAL